MFPLGVSGAEKSIERANQGPRGRPVHEPPREDPVAAGLRGHLWSPCPPPSPPQSQPQSQPRPGGNSRPGPFNSNTIDDRGERERRLPGRLVQGAVVALQLVELEQPGYWFVANARRGVRQTATPAAQAAGGYTA